MVLWAPLVAGAVGGGLGLLGQKSANKAAKKAKKEANSFYDLLLSQLPQYANPALAERQAAVGDVRRGYTQAIGAASGIGKSAQIDARDDAERLLGESTHSLISSGFYDPNSLLASRRGVYSDLQRVLGQIAEHTASTVAPLYAGRGEAVAGARGGVANQYMANFEKLHQLYGAKADIAVGSAPTSQDYSGPIGALFAGLNAAFAPQQQPAKLTPQQPQGFHGGWGAPTF